MRMKKNKTLVIGWDAADWKAINPLIEQGFMPNLKRMMAKGVSGKLATLNPPLSPMLWTSIATGKRPYKHGILGFTEPREDGTGIQPVLNTSRKCKAIWNILTQENYDTHVVGWWPSHPAEPINGVSISNFYHKARMPKSEEEKLEEWPLMEGTIHPETEELLFGNLRVHPLELNAAHLVPFLPNAKDIDQTDPQILRLITSVRKTIADCCTIHSAITYILENKNWDFAGVYYDAIDHFGHGFMRYHPPQQDHIPDHLFHAFHNVVTAGYRLHDMFLGQLLKLAGKDTNVLLISDHGFHPDHLRLTGMPDFPAAPALEHSLYGIIVGQGPAIKENAQIYGASLLDITPTLLRLNNLPVGRDMDGKVLKDLFINEEDDNFIDSWENVAGHSGMHPKHILKNQHIDQEAMEQLIELGYIDRPDPKAEVSIAKTVREINYWLAMSYLDGNAPKEAIPILEKLFDENTDQARYGHLLVNAYQRVGNLKEAEKILSVMRASSQMDKPNQLILEGKYLLSTNQVEEAIDKFNELESEYKGYPDVHLHLGQAHLMLKQYDWAKSYFTKALEIDSQNHHAFAGLGTCAFSVGEYEEAAKNFIESLSLMYYQPTLHYYLGECLEQLGDKESAAKAYNIAVELSNKAKEADRADAVISGVQSTSSEETESNGKLKEVIVVSGLPRSGTSMMMQMLAHGGLSIFSDNLRLPDENNPKGYYEHDKVKNLANDKSFLEEIEEGAVVKIIAQLLLFLPKKYRYKIIFMKRNLDEIIQSQDKMLVRMSEESKNEKSNRSTAHLIQSYKSALEKIDFWSAEMKNVDLLYVNYLDMLENTTQSVEEVEKFINVPVDKAQMASVIDKTLYREKILS